VEKDLDDFVLAEESKSRMFDFIILFSRCSRRQQTHYFGTQTQSRGSKAQGANGKTLWLNERKDFSFGDADQQRI
jgi:hypothetical protein